MKKYLDSLRRMFATSGAACDETESDSMVKRSAEEHERMMAVFENIDGAVKTFSQQCDRLANGHKS